MTVTARCTFATIRRHNDTVVMACPCYRVRVPLLPDDALTDALDAARRRWRSGRPDTCPHRERRTA